MVRNIRVVCGLIFIVCLALEAGGVALIVLTVNSFCVQGGEVSLLVNAYSLLTSMVLVPDLVAVILSIIFRLNTLGRDPVLIVYNFCAGLACIVGGIALLLSLIKFCGNFNLILICIAGILNVVAGIAHILNSILCHKKLPTSEKNWRSRTQPKGGTRRKSSLKKGAQKKASKEKLDKKASKEKINKKDSKDKLTDKKGNKKNDKASTSKTSLSSKDSKEKVGKKDSKDNVKKKDSKDNVKKKDSKDNVKKKDSKENVKKKDSKDNVKKKDSKENVKKKNSKENVKKKESIFGMKKEKVGDACSTSSVGRKK